MFADYVLNDCIAYLSNLFAAQSHFLKMISLSLPFKKGKKTRNSHLKSVTCKVFMTWPTPSPPGVVHAPSITLGAPHHSPELTKKVTKMTRSHSQLSHG